MSDKKKDDVSSDDVVEVVVDKVEETLDSAEETLEKAKDAGTKKLDDVTEEVLSSSQTESGSSRWWLIIILVLLIVAVIFVFVTKVTINPKDVEARLQTFEDMLINKAAQSGGVLDIKYGSMRIEGSLFSKKIVLDSPKVNFVTGSGREYNLATEGLEILPTGSDLDNVKLRITKPVALEYMGKSSEVAFVPEFLANLHLDKKTIKYDGDIPLETNVTKAGGGETASGYLKVTNGKFSGNINADNGSSSQLLSLNDGKIKTTKYEGIFKSLISKKTGSQGEGVANNDYDVVIKQLDLAAPMNIFGNLDVDFKIGQEMTSFSDEYGYPSEINYNLENISIKSSKSSINADGKFQVIENELIPLGKAEVNVSGVDNVFAVLKDKGVIDDKSESIARNIVTRIANEWKPETDEVNVILQREYGSGFYVGNVTFEELFAGALKEYFMGASSPLVAATPKITTKKTVKEVVAEKLDKTGVKLPAKVEGKESVLDKSLPAALAPVVGKGRAIVDKVVSPKKVDAPKKTVKPEAKINNKPVVKPKKLVEKKVQPKKNKPEVKLNTAPANKVEPKTEAPIKIISPEKPITSISPVVDKITSPAKSDTALPWLKDKSDVNSLEVPKELNIVPDEKTVLDKPVDAIVSPKNNLVNSVADKASDVVDPKADNISAPVETGTPKLESVPAIDPTLKQKLKEAADAAKTLQQEAK